MHSFFILYSTLAVFGIGVTIIDLFGILDQSASSEGGDSGGDTEVAADAVDNADASGVHDTQVDATNTESVYGDRGSWVVSGQSGTQSGNRTTARNGTSHGPLAVAKLIGTLRTGVYFSLGAGPTGLFALLTGVGGTASLAWSAGAGVFIAILAKTLRAFVRRDLDSSIKPEEFLMDQAVISVPVSPGTMGKAIVSRYGRDTELYVRCKDQSRALSKGEMVRIVDMDDDCYWVEAHG
ncbi:MAG: hypothetical protein AB7T74_17235 [Clostridia bacterium]|jgi:hypothetical protein|nr:hypothetical protein [Spirochaetia bacterium]